MSTSPQIQSGKFKLEPVWLVRVELATRDDERVREAVNKVAILRYGAYTAVSFESANGKQYFKSQEGSQKGDDGVMHSFDVRVLSFSIPRDDALLQTALEAIMHAHSYEEPVIYVTGSFATRAKYSEGKDNPNRWWNRGFVD